MGGRGQAGEGGDPEQCGGGGGGEAGDQQARQAAWRGRRDRCLQPG